MLINNLVIFEGSFSIVHNFQPTLAIFYNNRRIYIVVNGRILDKNLAIRSHLTLKVYAFSLSFSFKQLKRTQIDYRHKNCLCKSGQEMYVLYASIKETHKGFKTSILFNFCFEKDDH